MGEFIVDGYEPCLSVILGICHKHLETLWIGDFVSHHQRGMSTTLEVEDSINFSKLIYPRPHTLVHGTKEPKGNSSHNMGGYAITIMEQLY